MKSLKMLMTTGFFLLLASSFLLGQTQPQPQPQPQTPVPQEPVFRPALLEQLFPAFSLPTFDGRQLELASLKGKNVIIIVPRVYAAEGRWCTICNYQYADAVDTEKTSGLRQKFNAEILFLFPFDRNVVTEFLAVTPSQLEKIKGWKYPAEPDKLDAQGIPTVFILDKDGLLRFKYISQTTSDRPSWAYLMKILEMIEKK